MAAGPDVDTYIHLCTSLLAGTRQSAEFWLSPWSPILVFAVVLL